MSYNTESENPIVKRINLECRKDLRLSVMKFRDQAILVGLDSLHLGVNAHMTVEELTQFRDAMTEVLDHQGNDPI